MKDINELDGTAIEKWAVLLDGCDRRPYTQEEFNILLPTIVAESTIEKDGDGAYAKMVEENDNMVALIHKRIKHCHSYTTSKAVVLFLSMICDRPAIAVEYCNYMQYWCHENQVEHMDIDVFSQRMFPHGVFTEEGLRLMWQEQYVANGRTDNMLDHPELLESIWNLQKGDSDREDTKEGPDLAVLPSIYRE